MITVQKSTSLWQCKLGHNIVICISCISCCIYFSPGPFGDTMYHVKGKGCADGRLSHFGGAVYYVCSKQGEGCKKFDDPGHSGEICCCKDDL